MIKKMMTLFQMFDRALRNDPNGSRKDQFAAFRKMVKADENAIESLMVDYFDRMYAQRKIHDDGRSATMVYTQPAQQRAEAAVARRQEREKVKATRREIVAAAVERVRTIVLLDQIMPNGKKRRDCTGAELAKCGQFDLEISRHLKPNQVLDKHMNEADLQSMWSRFQGGKRRVGTTELHA